MNYQNLLSSINVTETLNKSEKKVASAILADPEAATGLLGIANLAKKAGVSEPSVNRFCKRFILLDF